MNDMELDRLLDTWKAPAPARSLRNSLRGQFPRAERLVARPRFWALVALAGSLVLAVSIAQSSPPPSGLEFDGSFKYRIYRIYDLLRGGEAARAARIVAKMRESEPKVYVDGQAAASLEYGPAATVNVQVPGQGLYALTFFANMRTTNAVGRPTGWIQAGHAHENVVQFDAGGRRVRIECNQWIVDRDRAVFVMHRNAE